MAGKKENEAAGVPIKEFFGLQPNIYLYLVNGNSEHKKPKAVNRNVVTTISNNAYKVVLLNKKCLRHSVNRKPRVISPIGGISFIC